MNKTITSCLTVLALSTATASAAPVVLSEHVTEALPPIDRPFTLEECTYGMGYVAFAMDVKLILVGNCKEPVQLFYEDEETPLFSVPSTNNIFNSSYVECPIQTDGTSNIVMWFTRAGINTPGKYRLEIPGSYFKCGDIYTKPATFTYTLVEKEASATFDEILTSSNPPFGKPFQPKGDFEKGLGTVTLGFDRNVELTSEDNLQITLKGADMTEGAFAAGKADVKIEKGEDSSQAVITFAKGGITFPGEYVLTVPDGFFLIDGVPVLGGELTYTLRAVGEAPKLEDLIENVVPPVDEPFTEDQYSTGVQNINITLDGKFTLNKDCQTPAVFYRDGEELYSILAGKSYNEGVPYPYMNPTDPNHPKLMFVFLWGKLVDPGHYELVIPDGYLLCGGEEVAGTTLNFYIKGALSLEDLIEDVVPPVDEPFTEDQYSTGVQNINITLDGKFTLNKDCETPAVFYRDGEELYSILAGKSYSEGVPYPYMNPTDPNHPKLMFIFLWGKLVDPGHYELVIPDGYLLCDGEKVAGTTLNFYLKAPMSLEDIVIKSAPAMDTPFDPAVDGPVNGISYIYITVDKVVTANKECTEEATLMKEGQDEPLYHFTASATTTPYLYCNKSGENTTLMFIFVFGSYVDEPGTYTLNVPDGFLLCGDEKVRGGSFTYIMTSIEDTVESIAAGFGEGKKIYRLDGTVVTDKYLAPGVYVIDGKKVIIGR